MGEVIHECLPRIAIQAFLRIIRKVERQADRELDLHFILDNSEPISIRRSRPGSSDHPRVHFHFVPAFSS